MARKHESGVVCSWFCTLCVFVVFRAVVPMLVAVAPAAAINLQLTPADIDRALVIARQRDDERARFHAPYITAVNGAAIDYVEIVTEFRRVVMNAEERILRGDRASAYSVRLAQEAVKLWDNRVSVRVRLRFHPLHAYVTVPDIGISVDGPSADAALIGVLKEPIYGFADPTTGTAPFVGAVAEGVFDAKLIGQTQRTVSIALAGKELGAVRLDFASVE